MYVILMLITTSCPILQITVLMLQFLTKRMAMAKVLHAMTHLMVHMMIVMVYQMIVITVMAYPTTIKRILME